MGLVYCGAESQIQYFQSGALRSLTEATMTEILSVSISGGCYSHNLCFCSNEIGVPVLIVVAVFVYASRCVITKE